MYFISTLLSILVLVALLVPGLVLKKTRLLSDTAAKDLSAILLYVANPALILYCMMSIDIKSVPMTNVIICVVISIGIILLGMLIARLLIKGDAAKIASAKFAAAFSNCGFFGIPIAVLSIEFCNKIPALEMGIAIEEGMLYATIFNVIFNILVWTAGARLFDKVSGGERITTGERLRKAFLNPCVLSAVVALPFTIIFSLNDFLLMRDPIMIGSFEFTQLSSIINYIYALSVPTSMLILGIMLADMSLKSIVTNPSVYFVCLIKIVIVPLVTVIAMLIIDSLVPLGGGFLIAMTVMAAAPSATTGIALSAHFGGDAKLASDCVAASTAISVLSIPLFLMLATAFL